MRNIIDKIVLIESENYKPLKIIENLKKSAHYDYEILVEVSVLFSGDHEGSHVDAPISFDYTITPTGDLEWSHQDSGEDYIVFFPNFEGFANWEYDAVVKNADDFLPEVKTKLKVMGFSDHAINNLKIITDKDNDFLLTGCKFINEEVINSYRWYREKVGDIE